MKNQIKTSVFRMFGSFLFLAVFTIIGCGTSLAESLKIESIYPQPGETFVSTDNPEGIEVNLNAESFTWTKACFNYTTTSELIFQNIGSMSSVPAGASSSQPVTFENGVLKINFLDYLEDARAEAKEDSEFSICLLGIKCGDLTLSDVELPNGVELDPTTGDLYFYYKFDYVNSSPYVYPDPTDVVFDLAVDGASYSYKDATNKNFFIPVGSSGVLRVTNNATKDNRLFYDKELTQLVPGYPTGSAKTIIEYKNLEIGHTYYFYGASSATSGTHKFAFNDGFSLGGSMLPSNGTVDVTNGDELPYYPIADGKLTINFTGHEAAQWFQVYENDEWKAAPYEGEYDETSLTYNILADGTYRLLVPDQSVETINATLTTSFREKITLKFYNPSPEPNTVYPFNKSGNLTIKTDNKIAISEILFEYEGYNGIISIPGEDINISLIPLGTTNGVTSNYLNLTNLQNIFRGTGTTAKYPPMAGDNFTVILSGITVNGELVDEITGIVESTDASVKLNYLFDPFDNMVKSVGEPNWPEYFTESGAYPAEPTVIEYESDIQFDGNQSIHVIGMLSSDPSGRDLPEGVDVPSFDLRSYSTISGNKLTIDFNALKEEYQSLDGMMTISVMNLLSDSKAVAPVMTNVPFKSTKVPTFTLTYEIEDQAILSTDVQEGSKITVSFPENNDFKVVSVSFNGENQEVGETYTTPAIEENSVLNIVYEYARDINFDFTTGINSPEDCPYTISHEGDNINIFGVKAGDNIKVYSLGGLKMADLGAVPSGKAVATFTLPTGNVYIVTINNKALKIKH
ncbi:MAG: hypothetical protein J1E95_10890 [Muribaculaceae bacterium]|nr:hypothetical protein [Muribaculaceae bacterium]